MNRIATICCCILLINSVANAQSLEKRALKSIKKAKWDKAASFLIKAVAKDSGSVLAEYAWSKYYFADDNPQYNVDLAYNAVNRALQNFTGLDPRQREKLSRFPLDSLTVVDLRKEIDSVAFSAARTQNTERAYIQFLAKHSYSSDRKTAEQLRNAVAFLDAVNQNTFAAFKNFLEKYPDANERIDAKARYDRLLFEEKTRDRRLASFETFLREYPETPFRKEIEKDIFELYTLSGEVERFLSYLKLYPGSPFQTRANNILFHILYDNDDQPPSGIPLTDSLRKVLELNEGFLIPFLKHGKFGFMNNKGFEVISAKFDELPDEYRCGNITDDLLVFPKQVLNRLGTEIFAGSVEELDDLGAGFLKIKSHGCLHVVHKSGFRIDSCVLDSKLIDKRFVAIRSEKGWSIRSLNGRPVLSGYWEEIDTYGRIIALRTDRRHVLLTFERLTDLTHEQEFAAELVVDEVKQLNNGMLLISVEGQQGVYDENLNEIVALNDHKIEPYFAGFIIRTNEGLSICDYEGNRSSFFESVLISEPHVVVKKDHHEYLFDVAERKFLSAPYDSIVFDGPFLKGMRGDSVFVQFQNLTHQFSTLIKTSFIPGKDSLSYLLIETEGKKALFNHQGSLLFTALTSSFESIQHAGQEFFIVAKKDKKGLVDATGKFVLGLEYDAIGTISNHTISVLKSSRFGLLNTRTRKLVKPQYEKNVVPYKSNLLIAFKDGRQGFIDWDNKPQGKFDLEEVKYWNDSTALVKRNKVWELVDLESAAVVIGEIRDIKPIRENADEKLFIMNQNNLVGVISSVRGKVIPFSFSDVVNVGSNDDPLYFTEKHVSEASVFVVIYYDKNGKMLRREVYEEPDDYERIYCKQN